MSGNRREQIIDAALKTFATHGYHKATIKEIAREAGLRSPALIYWYFPSKAELFRAVVHRLAGIIAHLVENRDVMEAPPEQVLTHLAERYLAIFQDPDAVRLFRTFVVDALRNPERNAEIAEASLGEVLHFLVAYFRHQIDEGRLRAHDPEVSSRVFMGALNAFVMGQALFPPLSRGLPEPAIYARHLVEMFLEGLRPEEEP